MEVEPEAMETQAKLIGWTRTTSMDWKPKVELLTHGTKMMMEGVSMTGKEEPSGAKGWRVKVQLETLKSVAE